jgi:hypothetical protein
MSDERVERLDEAECLLEAIGTQLLDDTRPADELWPMTAFSLASHARSHHRALLEGLAGKTPRASQIHARPIVETAILIHYVAEEPELRVWFWVADGLKEQLKMVREWRTSVERREADDASVGQLTEIIEDKERGIGALRSALESGAGRRARRACERLRTAFWVAAALVASALIPALMLPRKPRIEADPRRSDPTRPEQREGV